jgi:hypothetical protein
MLEVKPGRCPKIALRSRAAQGLFVLSADLAMFDEGAGVELGYCLA